MQKARGGIFCFAKPTFMGGRSDFDQIWFAADPNQTSRAEVSSTTYPMYNRKIAALLGYYRVICKLGLVLPMVRCKPGKLGKYCASFDIPANPVNPCLS